MHIRIIRDSRQYCLAFRQTFQSSDFFMRQSKASVKLRRGCSFLDRREPRPARAWPKLIETEVAGQLAAGLEESQNQFDYTGVRRAGSSIILSTALAQ